MLPGGNLGAYLKKLLKTIEATAATDLSGAVLDSGGAIEQIGVAMRQAHGRGNRLFFVGNGGSAGICSHMATDYSKNGGIRALALNDGAILTCLGNDFGYEHVFSKQLEWHATAGDVVVAISSSGRSPNILNAAKAARERRCMVVSLSGFKPDNPLRLLGDYNLYVDNMEYGFVELSHLALLHAVLDIQLGWKGGQ